MPSLISYLKVTDSVTTHTLRLPAANDGEQSGQEIATLEDGRTIVTLFDGFTLPVDQPTAIADSIEVLTLPVSDALRAQIKAASPHCRLISTRLIERIRAKYSMDDEQFLTRIGCAQALGLYTMTADEQATLIDYQATAEAARAWADAERAKLGL